MDNKEFIARRVAKEFKDGYFVNLGIGVPTLAGNYVPEGVEVYLHSENGLYRMGPFPKNESEIDPDLINASDQFITIVPGTPFFGSDVSFGIVRGGHLNIACLGGLQVDSHANLANWKVPGATAMGIGGGMDLANAPNTLIIAMEHTSKTGSRLVKDCTYPLTASGTVDMVVTEKCVLEFKDGKPVVTEMAPGVTEEELRACTDMDFELDPNWKVIEV